MVLYLYCLSRYQATKINLIYTNIHQRVSLIDSGLENEIEMFVLITYFLT